MTFWIFLALLLTAGGDIVNTFDGATGEYTFDGGGGAGGGSATDFIDAAYGIFGYWPLDAGATVCDDFGPNGHDLVEIGSIAHVAGLSRGDALDNQNGNNYCQATLAIAWPWNDTTSFAFGGWFSPQTDETSVQNALQLGARTEIREPGNSNGGNAYRIEANSANWHPSVDNLGSYSVDEVRMIYIEYDGAGTWKIISNGGTATPTGGGAACTGGTETLARTHTADSNDRLTIGGPGAAWDMEEDEFAIFDGVLSEADVCKAFQQGCWGDGGSCS